jgi:CRISPR/Cas system-associated exonuclease Cas4 (RecB family)
MSKVRYTATFKLPDGGEYKLTRGSREDYGYAYAWLVLENGAIVAKGFSRTHYNADREAQRYVMDREGRIALLAAVTK